MNYRFALIIEDNESLGTIYQMALQEAFFDSECVLDGKQALDRLKEVVPDLIILDMNLPRVSGHYILKAIRADSRLANTYVIIATANSPMAEALQPQLSDMDTILIKPVSPSELRNLAMQIQELLR